MFIDYTIRKEDMSVGWDGENFNMLENMSYAWILDNVLFLFYFLFISNNLIDSILSYTVLGIFSISYFFVGKSLLKDQRFKKTKYSLLFLIPIINIFFFKLEFISVVLSGVFKWILSIGEDYKNSSENELNNQIQRITEHNKRVTKKIEAIKKNIDSDTKIDKDILRDYERTLEILKN